MAHAPAVAAGGRFTTSIYLAPQVRTAYESLMPGALLASLVCAAAAVRIEGTTSCPDPAAVAARLADILPTAALDDTEHDRGRFWEEGSDLVIVLERGDGALLGIRRLPRTYSCEDLTAAVAVSLAAWENDVHPQFAPVVTARAVALAATQPALAPSDLDRLWTLGAGAALGFGASLDVPAAAGDAVIGLWVTPAGWRTAMRTEIEGQSEREIVLQGGRASWRRWSAALGLERAFRSPPSAAHPRGAGGRFSWFGLARLAWLNLHGEGFPRNHAQSVVDPGVTTGLRWLRAGSGGNWSLGLELAASFWPVRHMPSKVAVPV